MNTPQNLTPTSDSADRWLSRFVRLLRLPVVERWRIVYLAKMASRDYADAVISYEIAEAEARSSFWEHNQASYHKGRRDAFAELLRLSKPNIGDDRHRRREAP